MERLYEPLKYFEQQGKAEHLSHANEYFNDLLSRSGVDVEQNRATVKNYNKECLAVKNVNNTISKFRWLKAFFIILIVVGSIVCLSSIAFFESDFTKSILLILIGATLIVSSALALRLWTNPKIKSAKLKREEHEKKANEFLHEANGQVAPLNALFESDTPLRLIEKTIPNLVFEQKFTKRQESFMMRHNDFIDFLDDKSSMLDTLSGSLNGNPFIFCRKLVEKTGTQVYHGYKTISWTERYRDSNGNIRTRTRTQTLHAQVVKPRPFWNTDTYLAYGCQAAPDLNFSRTHSHSDDLSDRAGARKVKKGEKSLRKKAQKDASFQGMTNAEFDVLFGATNRDHEVQFRLMYTPLAQRNTLALIDDAINYGDDFNFIKNRRFNVISSEHAQNWDMHVTASDYYSYDVDEIKRNFINKNQEFFKSVFFDFAPLMAVPAYLEEPSPSLDEIEDYDTNYTYYEHEVMANKIGYGKFVNERSNTQAILKTSKISKGENEDVVTVTADSYQTVERVDFIPVLGGDRRMHAVPVPWLEYFPVRNAVNMKVVKADDSDSIKKIKSEMANGTHYHGLFAQTINK